MPFNVNRGMLAVDERLYNKLMYFSGRLSTQKLHSICYQTQARCKNWSHKDYYGYLNFDRHLADLDVFITGLNICGSVCLY